MTWSFKQRLHAGEVAYGFWHMTASAIVAEILAQAGYDCCVIDMEHAAGSYLDALTSMQAMSATGCQPIVRVPFCSRVEIKRALDAGAAGVMVPSVSTVEEAEEAARACRYPASGVRGMAPTVVRAANYGRDWQDYIARADAEVLCVCQIETVEAVENADAIAAVGGVDMLFVGPMDLSGAMGHVGQPDHPDVAAAMEKVFAAARRAGKLVGSIPSQTNPSPALAKAGYDMIVADADVLLLRNGADASIAAFRA